MGSLTANYGFYKPEQTEQFYIDMCFNTNLDNIDSTIKSTRDLLSGVTNTLNSLAIVGEVKLIAGDIVPEGFLACEGALLSRFSYPNLFSSIGYTFGGSGSTFIHPDLRGRVPVGLDAEDSDFNVIGEIGIIHI